MITLIGTGHIFKIGHKVDAIIRNRRPACVCLELDADRFYTLTHRDEVDPTGTPIAYRMLASFQERLADHYGAKIGEEMEAAANAAKDIGAAIACIDMSAQITFTRVWAIMPFEERIKLAVTTFSSMFARKRSVESELKRFEDDTSAYLNEFADQFPTIKQVLIDERNAFMARNIRDLRAKYRSMVVVVGDGHVDGLTKMLRDFEGEMEVVRLKALRKNPPEPLRTGTSTVGYTFEASAE